MTHSQVFGPRRLTHSGRTSVVRPNMGVPSPPPPPPENSQQMWMNLKTLPNSSRINYMILIKYNLDTVHKGTVEPGCIEHSRETEIGWIHIAMVRYILTFIKA